MFRRGPRISADRPWMPGFVSDADLPLPTTRTPACDAPARPGPKRRPSGRTHGETPGKLRIRWLLLPAAPLAGAFATFLALWLTEPARPSRAISVMTNSAVSDSTTLMAAVQTAGVQGTPDVVGAIEELRRLDQGRVRLKGWVSDAASGGAPLTVMAFTDGSNVLTAPTSGTRSDVARLLGLSDQAAANMSFQGSVQCSRGHRLIVIAITPRNTYGHFGERICP